MGLLGRPRRVSSARPRRGPSDCQGVALHSSVLPMTSRMASSSSPLELFSLTCLLSIKTLTDEVHHM